MKAASREARRMAQHSLTWFAGGLGLAVVLAGLSAWRTVRTILRPVQAVTEAAVEIAAGNLNQVVSYFGRAIYIELMVDGQIVDLNRIALPPDTPVIDERFKDEKTKQ